MFGIFRKKTEKEKLLKLYKKKKEEAFNLSRIDRIKSDTKEKEANEILIKIDALENKKEN